jgi:hypothetical protein
MLGVDERLIIATHNAGKLREFQELLAPYVKHITSAGELNLPEPEETGTTFIENALLKARTAAQLSGCVTLADDSGLCVNVLNGDPGIYSARWAEVDDREMEVDKQTGVIPLPLAGGVRGGLSEPEAPSPAKAKDLPLSWPPKTGQELTAS